MHRSRHEVYSLADRYAENTGTGGGRTTSGPELSLKAPGTKAEPKITPFYSRPVMDPVIGT